MSCIKIVATLGPSTDSSKTITALRDAGMDVARLNGSHNEIHWHARTVAMLREAVPDMPILLDLPGRKVRVAQLAHEPAFSVGQTIVLTSDPRHNGKTKIPISYPNLHKQVSCNDVILADDGSLRFTVTAVEGFDVICRAELPGKLVSAKGINIPGAISQDQFISDKDRQMITFASQNAIDFIGISFAEEARQVKAVRSLFEEFKPHVISKIESRGALDHLRELAEVSDAFMIDRGDLSLQTSFEEVTLLQKHILSQASHFARPTIVATEMLHSMIAQPTPTKAEISDITNAVLDGAAAVMLSGETAIGKYPVEAVKVMRRVANRAIEHKQSLLDRENGVETESVPRAVEDAINLISRRLPIAKIVAVTMSGYAARMISARMPRQPILAVSNNAGAARSFNLLPNTEGVFVDIPFSRTDTTHIPLCLKELWRRGKLEGKDLIVVTGVGYPTLVSRMNLIQIHKVKDLVRSLGWNR